MVKGVIDVPLVLGLSAYKTKYYNIIYKVNKYKKKDL